MKKIIVASLLFLAAPHALHAETPAGLPNHTPETNGKGKIERVESDAARHHSKMMNSVPVTRAETQPGGVKVLVLGNSITLHAPKPSIGWTNEWGMAASAREKDFVHLLTSGIARQTGRPADLRVRGLAAFERGFTTWNIEENLAAEIAFAPDYLIVALGENVNTLGNQELQRLWQRSFTKLLSCFCKGHAKPRAVVRGVFWPSPWKDEAMSKAAAEVGALFVKADVGDNQLMTAAGLFDHKGVQAHPGDRGMAEIATRILNALFPAKAHANHLDGRIGRKFDTLLRVRHFSHEARTTYYAETTNAFGTCYDDTHTDGTDYGHIKWHQGAGMWQGEYWGKTMLSAARAIEYGAPDGYRAWARKAALDFVRAFQRPDGYLATYRDPDFLGGPNGKGGETFCWNVWGRKYTIWALVELARACEEPQLLAAAEKVADHLIGQLQRLNRKVTETGYFYGIPSASILKPMMLLYERTGKAEYLDFCRSIVAELDAPEGARPNLVANAFKPGALADWYANPAYWAKAYEIMSTCEGLVEYARVTGEKRPLEAARRVAAALERDEGNVLGSVGYHDHFMHAARRANAVTEICDVIHWIFLQRELYREDRDVRRLDLIERAFLNAFQAGVYRNGMWGCHDVRSHGFTQVTAPFEVEMHYHSCCVDNAPRGFAAYADMIATAGKDGEAELNFYTDANASAAGVGFTVRGDYPVSNRITVEAKCASPKKVAFRVPGWCRRMTVDGQAVHSPRHVVELSGTRTFDIAFDMEPVIHDRDPATRITDNDDRPSFELVPALWCSTYSAIDTMRSTITRGPLLLAKAKATGMSDGEIFTAETVNGKGFRATLAPGRPCGTWGSWILTLEKDGVRKVMPVVDYATAADYEDCRNPFSVWF